MKQMNSASSKEKSFVGVGVGVADKSKKINEEQLFDDKLSRSKKNIKENTFVDCQIDALPELLPLQTDDVETNTTVNKRRYSEINDSSREFHVKRTNFVQSFNYLRNSIRHMFSYLDVKDLLAASRVCTTWNTFAMDEYLWKNVNLKNQLVLDWDKFVATIIKQNTVSLNTKGMLIPSKSNGCGTFWLNFGKAIIKAKQLETIKLYRCPTYTVENILYSLPKLKIFIACSIINSTITNKSHFMTLNLGYLNLLLNITEVRLNGLSGINLTLLPSFEELSNLKILSLTSMKSFPKDIYSRLDTITTRLEVLEIGDCDCLSKEFAVSLQRFINLANLRLVNCRDGWENIAEYIFNTIRSLEKLRTLELINIQFTSSIEEELGKCVGIRFLLIIAAYVSDVADTNCLLIDCFKKLSKTLTHLVWGLTEELLNSTDLFINQYQQNRHTVGYELELPHFIQPVNNIPILKTRKSSQRSRTDDNTENDTSDNIDIVPIPTIQKLLNTIMPHVRIRIIRIPFSQITRVYICKLFNNDL